MKLLNYRKGFACNSSSTHSVIANMKAVTDEFKEFGWEHFTCAPEHIGYYIAAAIESDGRPFNKPQMCAILGLEEDEWPLGGYVDHQSCPTILADTRTGYLLPLFVQDLFNWFKGKNAGVFGGNDNTYDEVSWRGEGEEVAYPYPVDTPRLVGRRSGSTWCAFDPQRGTKLHFSFEDNPSPYSAPELVDMKITNYCPFGCKYCYQGSTKEGLHAPLSVVLNALDDCANARVFEVAFGGGEPTLHPDFRAIVDYAASLGICSNVTTRNVAFLREVVASQWKKLGGVAVSVDSLDLARKVVGLQSFDVERLKVQMVDGVGDLLTIQKILDLLDYHRIEVTWLGYKQTGFGGKYLIRSPREWDLPTRILPRDTYKYGISVDTAILAQYGDALKAKYDGYGVTATEEEGVVSCYIDCVEGKVAKSSYCGNAKPYVSLMSQFGEWA